MRMPPCEAQTTCNIVKVDLIFLRTEKPVLSATEAYGGQWRSTHLIEQACLPPTASWKVIVDVGYSRQHVHWEWDI